MNENHAMQFQVKIPTAAMLSGYAWTRKLIVTAGSTLIFYRTQLAHEIYRLN